MLSKIAIHKSSEWKPEKKWRLFCSNNNPNFFYDAHSVVKIECQRTLLKAFQI